jgi:DNA primase
MTASHATVDFHALRAAVSISDVLTATGIDLPRRGDRIACPLHGGRNPNAFRFDDCRFCCFACGAHGDVFDLVQALDGCNLRHAIERVAALSGGTVLPAADGDPRRRLNAVRNRRRRALARWDAKCRAEAVARRNTCRRRVVGAAAAMDRTRDQQTSSTSRWDELDRALGELAKAECQVAELEPEYFAPREIGSMARRWLAEHSGGGVRFAR